MKRILALSVAVVMVLMMAVTVFAAVPSPGPEIPSPGPDVPSPGPDVPSPGPEVPSPDAPGPGGPTDPVIPTPDPITSTAPKLVAAYNENVDCIGEVVIHTYAERFALDAVSITKLEAAYNTLNTDDLGKLNKDLAELADDMKVSTKKLSVVQIFDISCVNCAEHDKHGSFTITVKPAEIKNFMGIMHYNGTEWELLEAEEQFGEITFVVDGLSPFVIIAHDGTAQEPTSTGAVVGVSVGCVAVVAAAAVIVVVIVKKKGKDTPDEEA